MSSEEVDFPNIYKNLLGIMVVGYREFNIIPFDMIDSYVSYVIQVEIRSDREFKDAIGIGYYR